MGVATPPHVVPGAGGATPEGEELGTTAREHSQAENKTGTEIKDNKKNKGKEPVDVKGQKILNIKKRMGDLGQRGTPNDGGLGTRIKHNSSH